MLRNSLQRPGLQKFQCEQTQIYKLTCMKWYTTICISMFPKIVTHFSSINQCIGQLRSLLAVTGKTGPWPLRAEVGGEGEWVCVLCVCVRPPLTCSSAFEDLMTTSSTGVNTSSWKSYSWKLSPCPRASIWIPTLAASWFLLFCWGRGLAGIWNRIGGATCSVLVSSIMRAYSVQFHEDLNNIGNTY